MDLAGIGDGGDLEVARDDGPVAEDAAQEGLLDLDRPHLREPDGGGMTAERPVDDEELLAGENDAGVIPAPDGGNGPDGGDAEEEGACGGDRPAAEKGRAAEQGDDESAPERADEHDAVAPRVEVDPLVHGFACFAARRQTPRMSGTARRAATATLVALSIVVAALALWKIKAVIALLFLGFIVAAAMRPGVEWLHRRAHIPRSAGVLIHYLALLGAIALILWLIVPRALSQVEQAIGTVPTTKTQLQHQTKQSTGIKHDILAAVQKRLKKLPSIGDVLHPLVSATKTAFEVVIGIFFMFAVGAYWIFERDRAIALVQSMLPRRHRRVTRDTWVLIDQKLGGFVRGELLLVVFVAVVLSFAFWLDHEPYWLLIGTAAGIFEVVPVIGPLLIGILAIGVGLTADWQTALGAGIAVLVLRQLEDLFVAPRVLGHAVGLSPLVVLVSVTAIGILLGGFYVLLAIPIAAVLSTLVDVVLRDVDPAEEDVPPLLFPAAKD